MKWIKEHIYEIFLFIVVSSIATSAYFYRDNEQSDLARQERSFVKCQKISTQFIKQNCYDRIYEDYVELCPQIALNGNTEGCLRDIRSRMEGLRAKAKFPLKLFLYFVLELILGSYFFYFKEKWKSF